MIIIAAPCKKKTYSTFTKYCYHKGTIPKDLQKVIPRSTRHSWRKQPTTVLNGDALSAFEKECLDYAELSIKYENAATLSASLDEIIKVYQQVISEAASKKQLLRNNKNLVLKIIDTLKDKPGLQKICNYLSISTHQYYAWKNNIDCTASLLKLRRKRFPTAAFIKDNIETVIHQYDLIDKRLQVIVDGGAENKGHLDVYLKTERPLITKIIARVDIPFANNVVEALHKKFKNEFLQGKSFANYFELAEALAGLIENTIINTMTVCMDMLHWKFGTGLYQTKTATRKFLQRLMKKEKRSTERLIVVLWPKNYLCPNIRTFYSGVSMKTQLEDISKLPDDNKNFVLNLIDMALRDFKVKKAHAS